MRDEDLTETIATLEFTLEAAQKSEAALVAENERLQKLYDEQYRAIKAYANELSWHKKTRSIAERLLDLLETKPLPLE